MVGKLSVSTSSVCLLFHGKFAHFSGKAMQWGSDEKLLLLSVLRFCPEIVRKTPITKVTFLFVTFDHG